MTLAGDGSGSAQQQLASLGSSEAFTLAVPGADSSQYAVYVDLDMVEDHYLDQIKDSRAREAVKSFRTFGASAHVTGDGESAFSVRLVSN